MSTVITAARRTAIGSFMGSLKDTSAVQLGVAATRAITPGLPLEDIQDVIVGNVLQAGQGMNPARQIALHAGLPQHVPGMTVNRVCGSGLQAVISAVQGIRSGDGRLYLAGGTENMSRAPYLLPGARAGYRLGNAEVVDSLQHDGLTDAFEGYAMGVTAEQMASRWNISREEQDQFAAESQRRAVAAQESGAFADEVVPVQLQVKKETVSFERDEYVRGGSTAASLARLRPAFLEGGTVTAGNSSGINDGAAMLALADSDYAKAEGLTPLAEVLAYATVGVDPAIMGIGPAYAVPLALEKAGLTTSDIDLWELNEAFAAQSLAVVKELKLDTARVNVTGGAIALGHPIGASGARVLVTLLHALRRGGQELGVASLCIGGGMGIAVVLRARG